MVRLKRKGFGGGVGIGDPEPTWVKQLIDGQKALGAALNELEAENTADTLAIKADISTLAAQVETELTSLDTANASRAMAILAAIAPLLATTVTPGEVPAAPPLVVPIIHESLVFGNNTSPTLDSIYGIGLYPFLQTIDGVQYDKILALARVSTTAYGGSSALIQEFSITETVLASADTTGIVNVLRDSTSVWWPDYIRLLAGFIPQLHSGSVPGVSGKSWLNEAAWSAAIQSVRKVRMSWDVADPWLPSSYNPSPLPVWGLTTQSSNFQLGSGENIFGGSLQVVNTNMLPLSARTDGVMVMARLDTT